MRRLVNFLIISRGRRADWLALALVVLLAAVGSYGAWQAIQHYAGYPPDFDEAVHVLPVLQIATDVRHLNWMAVLRDSYAQDEIALYPFFHSWVTAPFFLIWKPDILVARASGYFFLSATALVVFCLGRELSASKRWPWLAGLVGAGLVLAAMPLWVFSSLVYLEAAGLWVSMLALLCYVHAGPNADRPAWLTGASLCAVAALLTKYSFGLMVIGGIGLAEVLGTFAQKGARRGRRWLYLFGPFGLLSLLWFIGPNKLNHLLIYSHSQGGADNFWSLDSLLYYPRSLVRQYAAGPVSAAVIVLGAAAGLWHWRQYGSRAMVCYLAVGLVMLTAVPQKGVRFLFTVAPAAFALAAVPVGAAVRWATAPLRGAWTRMGFALLATGLLGLEVAAGAHHFSFFDAALEATYTTSPDTRLAYRFVNDNTTAQGLRPHILDTWYLFDAYSLEWENDVNQGGQPAADPYHLASTSPAPEPTPANLDELIQTLKQSQVSALVIIDGSPAGAYTGWQVVDPLQAQGKLGFIATSPPYTLTVQSEPYRLRVFSADFANAKDFEAARKNATTDFSIRLHVYSLTGP